MIRLSRPFSKWALLYLSRLLRKERADLNIHDLINEEADFLERKDDRSQGDSELLHHIYRVRDGDVELVTLADLLETLFNQLSKPDQDRKLIDLVVEIISKPMAREILSYRTLRDLRRALLNAEELAGLEDKTLRSHLHCSSCGRRLVHGEMMSVVQDRDENGNRGAAFTINCTACYVPEYAACGGLIDGEGPCDAVIPVNEKLQWLHKKPPLCNTHKAPRADQATNPAAHPAAIQNNRLRAAAQRLADGGLWNPRFVVNAFDGGGIAAPVPNDGGVQIDDAE